MSVPKTPDMPLSGRDAYDDEAFSRLTFAEQGLFWFLAWWQWQEGSIPAALDDVLDKVPRRKIGEAEKSWPAVAKFFPEISVLESRRMNPTLERKRLKAIGERGRRQFGAELTNQKRWGNRESEKTPQTALESPNVKPDVATQGVAPDFALAGQINAKIEASGLKVLPPLQLVVAWMARFGHELVIETIDDCLGSLSGKHFNYLQEILVSRADDPSQRPANRRKRPQMIEKQGENSGSRGPDGMWIPNRDGDYWGGN